MISLSKFKEYKKVLEREINKKTFRTRLLFEAINDEDFATEVLGYFKELAGNISSFELEEIYSKIRRKTIKSYEMAKAATTLKQRINFCLRSLAYFYLLECLDEYSLVSDNVIEEIKNKYPTNYLEVISEADKLFVSFDMKDKLKNQNGDLHIEDDIIKKYLCLKKWQDDQHYFFEGDYWNYIEKVHLSYLQNNSLNSFELEQEVLKKRLFDDLREKKILDLNICSILTELYVKKDIVKLIGGKMYGLAVLNSRKIPVPYSLVIPTFVDINSKDISFLKGEKEKYSVRSSADIEDGEKNSFAGMFDSFLNIGYEELLDHIYKVKRSIGNKRVMEYVELNKLEKPNMAVIIQAFKEPSFSGVWIGNSIEDGVLEWVYGNGEKLVSGKITPNTEIWEKSQDLNEKITVNNEFIGRKMIEYQKELECKADFEWMILDGKLIMLQFRPVTKDIPNTLNVIITNKKVIKGIPASQGIVMGKGIYLTSPNEELEEESILLVNFTGTSWVPNILKSKGVVTAKGGFLCHAAIICRELGKPCVTGVGEEAIKKISISKKIEINGTAGTIRILKGE